MPSSLRSMAQTRPSKSLRVTSRYFSVIRPPVPSHRERRPSIRKTAALSKRRSSVGGRRIDRVGRRSRAAGRLRTETGARLHVTALHATGEGGAAALAVGVRLARRGALLLGRRRRLGRRRNGRGRRGLRRGGSGSVVGDVCALGTGGRDKDCGDGERGL